MRIQLVRNLGREWPEPWREGDVVEVMDTIGNRLLSKGLAVRLPDLPTPKPVAPPSPPVVVEAVPAKGPASIAAEPAWRSGRGGRRGDKSSEG